VTHASDVRRAASEERSGEIEVAMRIEHLDLAEASFPAPYRLRGYAPGDEATWWALQDGAGIYGRLPAALFRREFADGDLRGRQVFVEHDATAVATATAWRGAPLTGDDWGRVHWLAVLPAHRRRGLARALMATLFAVFRAQRCRGAYLTTGSSNAPAIALYRSLGFDPWPRSTAEAAVWRGLETR